MERLVKEPIDLARVAAAVSHAGAGALFVFAGTVRNTHRGRQVVGIEYHAYEPMAEREIRRIEAEITSRWPEVQARIVHRIGSLDPGETAVVVAVASPHRREGFEALRLGIERLKETVPIWKKEMYTDGHAWLQGS